MRSPAIDASPGSAFVAPVLSSVKYYGGLPSDSRRIKFVQNFVATGTKKVQLDLQPTFADNKQRLKMDTDSLLQLLQATLDPNPNTRVQAELNLVEASRSSGEPDFSSTTAHEGVQLVAVANKKLHGHQRRHSGWPRLLQSKESKFISDRFALSLSALTERARIVADKLQWVLP